MIDYFSAINNNGSKDVPDYKSEVHSSKRASATKIFCVVVCFKATNDYIKFQTRHSVLPLFNSGKDFVLVQDTEGNNILLNTREVIAVRQWEE